MAAPDRGARGRLGRARAQAPAPRAAHPVIGRTKETELLRTTGAKAREKGAVLLLGGPAAWASPGCSTITSRTLPGPADRPSPPGAPSGAGGRGYGPFVEALATCSARARRTPPPGARRWPPGSPSCCRHPRRRRAAGGVPARQSPAGPDSGLSKDALFAAAVKALRTTAAERPLVLVVEDLHLAGAETVELFAHLGPLRPGHPMFLVGVYAATSWRRTRRWPS